MGTRTPWAVAAAVAAAAVIALGAPVAATAAPSEGYAGWAVSGVSGAYTGTASLPAGFPSVAFTSTSRTLLTPPISTGASSWRPADPLRPGGAFGAVFGSSQGKPYISFRPAADTAGAPSTTVYTFATPTPADGWGFVIGDIDAETIVVSATDPAGNPVAASALGFSAFNYCDSAGSSCAGAYPVPVTAVAGSSISAEDPLCPTMSANCDTDGEALSIRPTVPLGSLTVTSTWKQGFPLYQTWFAVLARSASGTVSGDCGVATPNVQVLDGTGAVIATAPANGGAFSFPVLTARSDYSVRVDPASLPSGAIAPAVALDLSTADVSSLALSATCPAVVDPGAPAPDPGPVPAPELAASGQASDRVLLIGLALLLAGVAFRIRFRPHR